MGFLEELDAVGINTNPAEMEKKSTTPSNFLEELASVPDAQRLPEQPKQSSFLDELAAVPAPPAAPKEEGTFLSTVSEAELADIAGKHKVDPNWLRSVARFSGARIEGQDISEGVDEQFLGFLGRSVAMNAPQFLYKKTQDESHRAAIDALTSKIEERKPGLGIAAEMVAGIATPIGAVGAAAKGASFATKLATSAGVGTALGGASGLFNSQEGEEIKDTLVGGAIGGVFGAALPVLGATAKKVFSKKPIVDSIVKNPPIDITKAVDDIRAKTIDLDDLETSAVLKSLKKEALSQDEMDALKEGALRMTKGAMDEDKLISARLDDLKSRLNKQMGGGPATRKELDSQLNKLVSAEGEQFAAKQMNMIRNVEATKEAIMESSLKRGQEKGNLWGLHWLDNKYMAKDIDNHLGTQLDPLLDKMSEKGMILDTMKAHWDDQIQKLATKAKAADLTPEQIYTYIDSKGTSKVLNPDQQKLVGEYQTLFSNLRDSANELGLNIKKRDWYVPHSVLSGEDFYSTMKQRIKQTGDHLGIDVLDNLQQDEFLKLKATDEDLVKAVQMGWGGGEITTANQWNLALAKTMDLDAESISNFSRTAALFAREGTLPAFIRETDVNKSASRWVNSTLNHALIRENEGALRSVRDQIAAVGGAKDVRVQWMDNLIADIAGSERKTWATAFRRNELKWKLAAKEKMDTATNPVAKSFYRTAHDLPDIISTMNSALYTNVLATKPRALFTNFLQPLALGAPELGGTYGLGVLKRTIEGLVTGARKGGEEIVVRNPLLAKQLGVKVGDTIKTKDPIRYLQAQGMMGEFIKRGNPDFKKGLEEGLISTGMKGVQDQMGKLGVLYASVETSNRYLTARMGNILAQDLLAGNKSAAKYVNQLEQGYKSQVTSLLNNIKVRKELGNSTKELEQELSGTLMRHMVSKSAFNYDKYSASQFARSVGPMLSQFTKWPTSILGDVISIARDPRIAGQDKLNRYAQQKFSKYMSKYLLPTALVWGGHQLATGTGVADTEGYKQLVGRGSTGLTSTMPIASAVGALTDSTMFTPPILEAAGKGAKAFGEDPADLDNWMNKTWKGMRPFVPGEGIYRLLVEDIPALME